MDGNTCARRRRVYWHEKLKGGLSPLLFPDGASEKLLPAPRMGTSGGECLVTSAHGSRRQIEGASHTIIGNIGCHCQNAGGACGGDGCGHGGVLSKGTNRRWLLVTGLVCHTTMSVAVGLP